ncbi:unnamed protein product [Trichogramma brassicae]|uniref:FLYWCH-type domain-containing protein n=1 Tax=Trichogramma brassicae TaxID=86971 RepID=A0A6H5IXV5_9HYME|nr:unnamed protein product [Trichogramma brassicae]
MTQRQRRGLISSPTSIYSSQRDVPIFPISLYRSCVPFSVSLSILSIMWTRSSTPATHRRRLARHCIIARLVGSSSSRRKTPVFLYKYFLIMNNDPEIVNEVRLFVDGYVYVRSMSNGNRVYWDCQKLRSKECRARAITISSHGTVTVVKGPEQDPPHSHPPNREVAEAEKIKLTIKKQAETIHDRPGSALVRDNLAGVSSGVLSQLPERENLKQTIRRVRKADDEERPTFLADFEDFPEKFKKTSTDDRFLIYDSRDDGDPAENRILVFATRKNLEVLAKSSIWFLDGTFKRRTHSCVELSRAAGGYHLISVAKAASRVCWRTSPHTRETAPFDDPHSWWIAPFIVSSVPSDRAVSRFLSRDRRIGAVSRFHRYHRIGAVSHFPIARPSDRRRFSFFIGTIGLRRLSFSIARPSASAISRRIRVGSRVCSVRGIKSCARVLACIAVYVCRSNCAAAHVWRVLAERAELVN